MCEPYGATELEKMFVNNGAGPKKDKCLFKIMLLNESTHKKLPLSTLHKEYMILDNKLLEI